MMKGRELWLAAVNSLTDSQTITHNTESRYRVSPMVIDILLYLLRGKNVKLVLPIAQDRARPGW